ncbi:SpoIIE family protein phosphatase [Acidobacteria bacterium AH-259-L09]|nr:SpoIIE family protein phosphatase [Acidobacteria bacterium AH-259-L09]
MRNEEKTKDQLISELAEMRRQLAELERLESQYKRVEETSHESEKRFRKIFDHSNDAILVVDAVQNEIVDVNSQACKMLGYSREELLSMPISAIHPHEMPKLLAFAKSVSGNAQGWTDELSCLTKTGQFLPAEISASMIAMSGRSCMIALVRDISVRKRAEEELRKANERMKSDLQAAAKVQESLLPEAALNLAGVSFAWAFKPCEELGGDIFNVFPLDEQHMGLYVLDVSGHGVVAALLSVTLNRVLSPAPSLTSVLKQHIGGSRYRLLAPGEVAGQLNEQFPMDPARPQYFTLLYGMLNLETYEFRYVSAGHPGPVYLAGTEEPVILEAPGFPIGFFEEVNWEERIVSMNPGDRLYLYSDGITEAMNTDGEAFGKERLICALHQSRARPLEDSLSSLLGSVEEWCSEARLEDDISVLAVGITQ